MFFIGAREILCTMSLMKKINCQTDNFLHQCRSSELSSNDIPSN